MLPSLLATCIICFSLFLLTVPLDCWRTIRANFRRLDGSFSASRCRREFSALLDYATSLALPFILIVPAIFVGASAIFRYIIRADLLVSRLSDFSLDRQEWKTELHDEKAKHAEFLQEQGLDTETTQQFQDIVWYGSPILCVVAAVFALVGFVWVLKCIGRSAGKLAAGIRQRRREYARHDVQQMSHPEEPITSPASPPS